MNKTSKKIVESYLQKYLEYQRPDIKINNSKLFECPFSHEHEDKDIKPSCKLYTKYGYKLKCFNSSHRDSLDIFAVFRKFEPSMASFKDEEIAEYLINLLDIKTNEKIDELFNTYYESEFYLIPLQSGHKDTKEKPKGADENKKPLSGISWVKTASNNITQWKEWYEAKLNFGLALGKISKVIAIDIDSDETLEKMKSKMGDTAVQTTTKGFHFLYQYEEWMDNINHINLRSKGYEMEFRANNAYIAIAPSSIRGEERKWNGNKIIKMPDELKEFLQKLIDKSTEITSEEDKLQELFKSGDLNVKSPLKGLDGECNDTFIKLGGLLRKRMSAKQVEWSLYNFNKLLERPMDYKHLKAMLYQLKKYDDFDKKEIANDVLEHLKLLETSTARGLKDSLGYEMKTIEEVLAYLVKEEQIKKSGKIYKFIPKIEWETDFISTGEPLNFEIPYFGKYARFDSGSMIVIGASTGKGKTHLACNLLKEFKDINIVPNYISTEAGSKFGIISATLGLNVGDYKFIRTPDASTVELEDNTVTIIDWLKPPNSEYHKTDTIYEALNGQLVKHGGLLIIMVQLRKEGTFFASDLFDFYCSLVATYNWTKLKYLNDEVSYDSENTFFKTEKIRDSKSGQQYITIPTHFNKTTKRITLRGQ